MQLDLPAFRYLLKGALWSELWSRINKNNCWDMAAQLSFYFLLAFFPFILFLSALLGFIPFEPRVMERILFELDLLLPETSFLLVQEILINLMHTESAGVLSLGIFLSLWWASMGFGGIVEGLNRAQGIREHRSYFHLKGLALLVTLAVSVFIIASGTLLFFGDWLAATLGLGEILRYVKTPLRWLLIFAFVNTAFQIIYFALPARRPPLKLVSPGGVFFTLSWLLSSEVFRFYVGHFAYGYQKFYGSLGALIMLMVWFYLSSLSLLVGGEVDGTISDLRSARSSDKKKGVGKKGRKQKG